LRWRFVLMLVFRRRLVRKQQRRGKRAGADRNRRSPRAEAKQRAPIEMG
jgi:hypothetical protein